MVGYVGQSIRTVKRPVSSGLKLVTSTVWIPFVLKVNTICEFLFAGEPLPSTANMLVPDGSIK